MKKGILLINLGTPEAATTTAVRRYLREFLSDPYVIDIPALPRWILLNTIILPFRTKQSTEAYQKIWTSEGSPLLTNSKNLTEKLQNHLGEAYRVELGMRYRHPSILSAIKKLVTEDLDEIIIVPLYPQYSESTTRSSLQYAQKIIQQLQPNLSVKTIPHFYQNNAYIQAKANLMNNALKEANVEKVIFSYHGLPERHVHRVCHAKSHCNLKTPCPSMMDSNQHCYRAQCYATSQLLANQLGLKPSDYLVTFQSRLGKTPWIAPYTDTTLTDLAKQGIKNIAIVCPSFVSDCLETLEEIDIRAKHQWKTLGGNEFIRIPCLNDHSTWIDAMANIISQENFQ